MVDTVVRRSARLAAAAASCGLEPIIALRPAIAKTAGRRKQKNVLKEENNVGVKSCDRDLMTHGRLQTASIKSPEQAKALVKHPTSLTRMPSRDIEAELWEMGFEHVAGVDEAGRGPLAGPVVAAACIIPSSISIEGINDSKKLSHDAREKLYLELTTTPGISYAVDVIDAQRIDEINIYQATMQAMAACVKKLSSASNGLPCNPDFVLIDGNKLPVNLPEGKARSVVKGDESCFVIAAASILAKVTRDRLMIKYDKKWPLYGFKSHKGYGTVAHIEALLRHGPCDIHRRSFAPLKDQDIVTDADF